MPDKSVQYPEYKIKDKRKMKRGSPRESFFRTLGIHFWDLTQALQLIDSGMPLTLRFRKIL